MTGLQGAHWLDTLLTGIDSTLLASGALHIVKFFESPLDLFGGDHAVLPVASIRSVDEDSWARNYWRFEDDGDWWKHQDLRRQWAKGFRDAVGKAGIKPHWKRQWYHFS